MLGKLNERRWTLLHLILLLAVMAGAGISTVGANIAQASPAEKVMTCQPVEVKQFGYPPLDGGLAIGLCKMPDGAHCVVTGPNASFSCYWPK